MPNGITTAPLFFERARRWYNFMQRAYCINGWVINNGVRNVSDISGAGVVTVNGHGISTGQQAAFVCTDAGPSGLTLGAPAVYFVRSLSTNTLGMYLTSADANADTNRVITGTTWTGVLNLFRASSASNSAESFSEGQSYLQYFAVRFKDKPTYDLFMDTQYRYAWRVPVADGGQPLPLPNGRGIKQVTAIDTTGDTVTSVGHGLATATSVGVYSDTNAYPAGLATNVTYFVRAIDADTLAFYPTSADATADTNRIDIGSTGTIIVYTILAGGGRDYTFFQFLNPFNNFVTNRSTAFDGDTLIAALDFEAQDLVDAGIWTDANPNRYKTRAFLCLQSFEEKCIYKANGRYFIKTSSDATPVSQFVVAHDPSYWMGWCYFKFAEAYDKVGNTTKARFWRQVAEDGLDFLAEATQTMTAINWPTRFMYIHTLNGTCSFEPNDVNTNSALNESYGVEAPRILWHLTETYARYCNTNKYPVGSIENRVAQKSQALLAYMSRFLTNALNTSGALGQNYNMNGVRVTSTGERTYTTYAAENLGYMANGGTNPWSRYWQYVGSTMEQSPTPNQLYWKDGVNDTTSVQGYYFPGVEGVMLYATGLYAQTLPWVE